MASKVTPVFAETIILLRLWSLDETPAPKYKIFTSKLKAYPTALDQLVKDGVLMKKAKTKRTNVYDITDAGKARLATTLTDETFSFGSNAGPKTINALLQWFRERGVSDSDRAGSTNELDSTKKDCRAKIDSYEAFTETALESYERLNQDYNLDNLVPIYRIRREIGDRLPRKKFNEWLLEVQANDHIQLMGSDLSDVTPDQMEDSLTIPGAGARFFVKRLT